MTARAPAVTVSGKATERLSGCACYWPGACSWPQMGDAVITVLLQRLTASPASAQPEVVRWLRDDARRDDLLLLARWDDGLEAARSGAGHG